MPTDKTHFVNKIGQAVRNRVDRHIEFVKTHISQDTESASMKLKELEDLQTLCNNMRSFTNKKLFNCSYNILKFILIQDVIFIDPPWGGSIYKTKMKVDLFLDGLNVINIIDSLYNYTRIIALKVPNNYNRNSISSNFWNTRIFSINKSGKSIYKLIIFYK